MINPEHTIEAANTLAHAIVNTIPEPFIVLDQNLRVVAVSRSFYEIFKVNSDRTQGCLLYELGDGQWDIPALRLLLETIIPEKVAVDDFEVEHDFPGIGRKIMLLNARQVVYADSPNKTILLAFRDITARRAIENEKKRLLAQTEDLLNQKQILIQELQHRVGNSLQIIASILLMKARAVSSEETRRHLQDAHQRVMSVAAVQQHIHAVDGIDEINVQPYLDKLCSSLAASMIDEGRSIAVKVMADEGKIACSDAVSIGLIVTELLINSIKYAFPEKRDNARVLITFELRGTDWKLVISDNGVGKSKIEPIRKGGGLGTAIVKALVQQLDAHILTGSDASGTNISITHATFASKMPLAS